MNVKHCNIGNVTSGKNSQVEPASLGKSDSEKPKDDYVEGSSTFYSCNYFNVWCI